MGTKYKKHKYIKKIENYYGKGRHKYVYQPIGVGKDITARRSKAMRQFRNLVWPEMSAEEKQYFEQYAMATGKMAPLWPFVMERAFRLADIPFTIAGAGAAGKGVGTLVRLAGKKVARKALKQAMMQALRKATEKGIKTKLKFVGKGIGKAMEGEYKISVVKRAIRGEG